MSSFISGVANPMTQEQQKPNFKPPPETRNTGIYAPGYGKKDNTNTLQLGVKPNQPIHKKGTKTPPTFMPDPTKIY